MNTTIITVSFNSEKTISQTIESVLNQTKPPLEYIIVDGASNDNTLGVCESYKEQFRQKGIEYTIISEQDKGIYDAMNKGIKKSKGEIVGMINSDDWYELDAVEKVTAVYSKTPFELLFADLRVHKQSGIIIKRSSLKGIVTSRRWNHPTTFMAKSVYNEKLYALESLYDDFDMYIRLRKEKRNIIVLNEVLANFRFGGVSTQKSIAKAWKRTMIRYKIYRKNGYSLLYFFECLLIEGAKLILS